MRSASATLAITALFLVAACSAGPDVATTVPPSTSAATTTTEGTTTTTTGPTTTTTTSRPTTTTVPMVLPDLLRASSSGIELVRGDESIPVWADGEVAVALADRRGGVVFQRPSTAWLTWSLDLALRRLVPTWYEGDKRVDGSSMAIEWVSIEGGEPQTLVPSRADESIVLLEVTELAGRRVALFHREYLTGDCPLPLYEPACLGATLAYRLVALDLDGGEQWELGTVQGPSDLWSWWAEVAIAGDHLALSSYDGAFTEEGFPNPATVEVFDLPESLVWDSGDLLPQSGTGTLLPPGSLVQEPSPVALSPDGTTLVYYQHPVSAVVVDLATGLERWRFHTATGDFPTWLRFDGRVVIRGHEGIAEAVGADGSSMKLPHASQYSFWWDDR